MFCFFFFFKQKTAYEMRISDWSSDACSSDLSLHQSYVFAKVISFPLNSKRAEARLKFNGEDGFPHSEIVGSKVAHTSPTLIAACHEIGRASCRERVCQYV